MGREVVVTVGAPLRGGGFACVVDGRRAVVRHALPGEVVRAVVRDEEPLWLDAVEVLEASEDRVVPPCPYAGTCGGCDWQHASYDAQLRLKSELVSGLLGRDVTVETVGEPLGWRTRVRFAVDEGRIGFMKHRSNEVEPVEACLIASEGVESVGAERLPWPVASHVEVVAGSSGDRLVVVTPRRRGARVGAGVEGVSVMRGDEQVRGRPGVREVAAGRTWWVSGSGFWQSHVRAPEVLVDAVLDSLGPGDLTLDLYAGVGLFAGALAPHVSRVVAVESSAQACSDARQNLRDLRNVEVHEGTVENVLSRLGLGRCDLVVLDPPRVGAGAAVMAQIEALSPRRVAYVSCDPASLARDLRATSYRLVEVRAFDLFPMTWHVECVATLEPA